MFQLGWAEASREAYLNNLGPLSSVAKAVAATEGEAGAKKIIRRADDARLRHNDEFSVFVA